MPSGLLTWCGRAESATRPWLFVIAPVQKDVVVWNGAIRVSVDPTGVVSSAALARPLAAPDRRDGQQHA